MALANILLLSQIAGHVILFILSLCMVIPMGINIYEFGDRCLLFTTGKWREEDGMFDVKWASTGYCSFPLFTGLFLSLLSLVQIYRYARMKDEPSFLALFMDAVAGSVSLVFSIVSSVVITLGFIVWCESMTERFPSCEMSAGQKIINGPESEKIDTSNFYMEMGTTQFGAWGCFATTVGITVIAHLKLINNHQLRNIKVSMYLERQRLVNQHQAQLDGRSTPPLISSTAGDSSVNSAATSDSENK